MRRPVLVVLTLSLVTVMALAAGPAAATGPTFSHLRPGGLPALAERVPVNVVFVGFDQRDIDYGQLEAGLPRRYEPVVRSRLKYDQVEKLGIRYSYDYRITFADRGYENAFFGKLARLGRKVPLSPAQELYNEQPNKAAEVTSNTEIPAPAVERWLADRAPPGVDTRRNTVYLINWYERSDFAFHVYTKTDEPDPDTGYNFGTQRGSRKVTAWGGTTARDEESGLGSTRRVWFYDISAGPEEWAGSWNITDEDLDGGGPDYRIPPIWEYGHYRPAAALSADLSKLTRYVAIDLLFTTSPLYPAELPSREPPSSVNLDVNTYEGWPGTDASVRYLKPRLITAELRELLRFNYLDYDSQDLPFTGDAERCYDALALGESCYPETGFPPLANLYLQNTRELARTQDDTGRVDYELPIFAYAVDTEDTPALGLADDNYVDGTQSYVFAFVSPGIVDAGYGLSTSVIHEVGHHVGLSHPHDGYDSEGGNFEPTGDFYFAWTGDFSNSMMSYIDLNWDFSRFDIDNLSRFQTAASIEAANRLAAAALTGHQPRRAQAALRAADRLIGFSEDAFRRHQYSRAQALAAAAYHLTVRAAERAGVDVDVAEAPVRSAARAARAAGAAHEGAEFIDSLENGPRNLP